MRLFRANDYNVRGTYTDSMKQFTMTTTPRASFPTPCDKLWLVRLAEISFNICVIESESIMTNFILVSLVSIFHVNTGYRDLPSEVEWSVLRLGFTYLQFAAFNPERGRDWGPAGHIEWCRRKKLIKQSLDEVLVIFSPCLRLIKVEVRVISRSWRLRLITLTETLIILGITKTESNDGFIHWTKKMEVVILFLHWREATQSARTRHDYPWLWVPLTWLLYNLKFWRHGRWFWKFTLRFRPIGKEFSHIEILGIGLELTCKWRLHAGEWLKRD